MSNSTTKIYDAISIIQSELSTIQDKVEYDPEFNCIFCGKYNINGGAVEMKSEIYNQVFAICTDFQKELQWEGE